MLVVAKELAAEKSRLAYSDKTRLYLRRRAWRTLRRLGRADSPHYVALAVSVLLQVRDSDAATPRSLEFTRWNSAERTERRVRREYDEWANLLVFNHILRDEDPAYDLGPASRAWHHKPKKNGEAVRGEAFPHLWNRTPAAALDLLKRSLCSPVHDAAIRMLAELAVRVGRSEEALHLLERCLELAPGFREARQHYALVLHRDQQSEPALSQLETLLADDPRNPGCRTLKAAILCRLGEYDASAGARRNDG